MGIKKVVSLRLANLTADPPVDEWNYEVRYKGNVFRYELKTSHELRKLNKFCFYNGYTSQYIKGAYIPPYAYVKFNADETCTIARSSAEAARLFINTTVTPSLDMVLKHCLELTEYATLNYSHYNKMYGKKEKFRIYRDKGFEFRNLVGEDLFNRLLELRY